MATTRSLRPAVVAAGVVGSAALVVAMSGTLSAFTADIQNTTNTAGVGSLMMRETLLSTTGPVTAASNTAGTICETTASTTSATCSTINKYGGNLTMSSSGTESSETTSISITNTGTMAASTFTLSAGACTLTNTSSTTGDLCSMAKVTILQDGVAVATDVAPSALGTITLTTLGAGASSTFDITVSTAGLDNTVQGQQISQPLTWTFNA